MLVTVIIFEAIPFCFSRFVLGNLQNYTGDRLNFGLAAEQAKSEGYKIEVDGHITSLTILVQYNRTRSNQLVITIYPPIADGNGWR